MRFRHAEPVSEGLSMKTQVTPGLFFWAMWRYSNYGRGLSCSSAQRFYVEVQGTW